MSEKPALLTASSAEVRELCAAIGVHPDAKDLEMRIGNGPVEVTVRYYLREKTGMPVVMSDYYLVEKEVLRNLDYIKLQGVRAQLLEQDKKQKKGGV